MSALAQIPLVPILTSLFLIACSLIAAEVRTRKTHISRKEFLGFGPPKFMPSVILMIGFIALTGALEVVYRHAGLGANTSWVGKYSAGALAIRIVGILVLAPLGEELLFRGVIFKLLATKSTALAILITAALFAGSHFQYSWLGMVLVFMDGLYYGLARAWSGSTLLTIAMHCAGNGVAVYQRLQ
jgi:membrane protease YdiL (CAAX protease family)